MPLRDAREREIGSQSDRTKVTSEAYCLAQAYNIKSQHSPPESSRPSDARSFAISAIRRREKRTRAVMTVKVSVLQDPSRTQHSACTLDVAGRGARVSGIKFASKAGEIVL